MDSIAQEHTLCASLVGADARWRRWRRWLPPVLEPEAARLACSWARARAGVALPGEWRVEFGGAPVDLAPPAAPLPGTVSVDLGIGGTSARAETPAAMLGAALAALGPAAVPRAATAEVRALLIELALEPHLVALEARLGVEVRITRGPHASGGPRARRAPAQPAAAVALPFSCVAADAGSRFPARLVAPLETALALAEAAAAFPGDRRRRLPGDLPVPVSVRAAAVDLTRREAAALGAGDVVLPAADRRGRREAVAVAGETYCWIVATDGGAPGTTARVASPRRRAGSAGLEEWTMSAHQPTAPDPGETASLDDLPVRLVFEVGRFDAPLAELENMGPGFVLPLAPDLDRGEVNILANGRTVGRGELVRLGDGGPLGIRVLQMFGRGPEASPCA